MFLISPLKVLNLERGVSGYEHFTPDGVLVYSKEARCASLI